MHHPSPYMECGVLFFWWRFFWMTAIFHSGGKIFGHNGKRHFFRPPGGSRYKYIVLIFVVMHLLIFITLN